MSAQARLQEAVDAMRNIKSCPAAEWERRYPDFVRAVNVSSFIPSGMDQWDRRVSAMTTELTLRMAEALLERSK